MGDVLSTQKGEIRSRNGAVVKFDDEVPAYRRECDIIVNIPAPEPNEVIF
jgi:hypothetical protein